MNTELQQSIEPQENILLLVDNFDDDPETCFIQFITNSDYVDLK